MPAFTLSRRNAKAMDQLTLKRSTDTVHTAGLNHFVARCDGCRDGRLLDAGQRDQMLHHLMVDVTSSATSYRVTTCCASPVECHLPGPHNHDLSNRAGATLLILSRSFVLLISQHVVPPVLCVPRQSVDKAELLLLSRLATIYAAGTPLV